MEVEERQEDKGKNRDRRGREGREEIGEGEGIEERREAGARNRTQTHTQR